MSERSDDDQRPSEQPAVTEDVTGGSDGVAVGRREVLTALGALVAAPAAATQRVSAEGSGYGTDAYGGGPYGHPSDGGDGGVPDDGDEDTPDDGDEEPEEVLAVQTGDPTGVDESSATLTGELAELEGYDGATVYFEWGSGGDLSNATDGQTLTAAGAFADEVNELESGTEYEYRAVAEAGGDSETGERRSFTTETVEEEPITVPEIERLEAWDTSNPNNPHTDVCVEWRARADEGQLDSALVTVSDSSEIVLSWEYDLCEVCGRTASRTENVRLHRGGGETYTVDLTVQSADGTTDSEQTTFDSP